MKIEEDTTMSILSELEQRGIKIEKAKGAISDYAFYRGYRTTPQGAVAAVESRCDEGMKIYFLNLITDKETFLPVTDKKIYILYGTEYANKKLTEEEAEALGKEGKICAFKVGDLYAEYYHFSEDTELESIFRYGYSVRSRKYIAKIMQNIGLTSWTEAEDSYTGDGKLERFDHSERFAIALNADTEIGKLGDRHWLAQTCIRAGIDTFTVVKQHFDHHPSVDQINTAFDIRRFEYNPKEVFTCWECGRMTHWLDVPGNLHDKLDRAEDNYCGC